MMRRTQTSPASLTWIDPFRLVLAISIAGLVAWIALHSASGSGERTRYGVVDGDATTFTSVVVALEDDTRFAAPLVRTQPARAARAPARDTGAARPDATPGGIRDAGTDSTTGSGTGSGPGTGTPRDPATGGGGTAPAPGATTPLPTTPAPTVTTPVAPGVEQLPLPTLPVPLPDTGRPAPGANGSDSASTGGLVRTVVDALAPTTTQLLGGS